jgi:predicted nucleic acid-binding protein
MTTSFVDAGVLIAANRSGTPLGDRALAVLADPSRVFASSEFVHLEVMPKAVYNRRAAEVAFYRAFFEEQVGIWAEADRLLANWASNFAERYGLAAMDALHVAAAVLIYADELITTERPEKPIHRVSELRIVTLYE